MAVAFTVNGKAQSVDVDANTPLLWVVREHLKLTGTKFGCGAGLCGACTVHVDGKAVRSCQTTMSEVAGKKVTTIEGLSPTSSHPLQKAWIAEQVPQCGYCQSGQIMQAAELLAKNKKPSREQIVAHMDGNICRCGTYQRASSRPSRRAARGLTMTQASLKCSTFSRRGFLSRAAPPASPFSFALSGMLDRPLAATRPTQRSTPSSRSAKTTSITITLPGLRDGAGRAHVAAADPRRGARRRLVQGARGARRRPTPSSTAIRMFHEAAADASAASSVTGYYMPLRIAGAQARKVLLDNAAAADGRCRSAN